MEVEENQATQTHKRLRVTGRTRANNNEDEEETDGAGPAGGSLGDRIRAWQGNGAHTSSRIFRVSRASGGKDRHSKVLTAKGLRDRRVRLSVSTAIQFYDLQDRLGCDQPSKAIEWLIKAAADSITELPSLDASSFPTPASVTGPPPLPPKGDDPPFDQPHQQNQQSKSACSTTSETSKGSVLSLSRSENRVKDDVDDNNNNNNESDAFDTIGHHQHQHQHQHHPNSHSSSFTELLTGTTAAAAAAAGGPNLFFHRPMRSDFFGPTKGSSAAAAGFFAHAQFGNGGSTVSLPPAVVPLQLSNGSGGGNHQQQHNHHHHQAEMQQFPFLQDHLIPVDGLNSSISSSLSSGFNRGTLQSNSAIAAAQLPPHNYHHHHQQQHPQHQLHQLNRQHFQRLSSPIVDGPTNNLPFFFATTATAAPGPATEAQLVGFDGRGLQLYYDDGGCRNSDLKGKGKG